MGRLQRSAVWNYFEKEAGNSRCTIEGSKDIVPGQKAGNLKQYLKSHHRDIFELVEEEDAKLKFVDELPPNQPKLSFTPQPKKMSKQR